MTNFEARMLALVGAWQSGSADALGKVYSDLAMTERNFVLRKGETTVTLRRDEVDQAHIERLAGSLVDVIRSRVEAQRGQDNAKQSG